MTSDILKRLLDALMDCEDSSAMPDGTQGELSESFWVAGNVGRKVIDLARCHAYCGRQQVVLVREMGGSPDFKVGSLGVVLHVRSIAATGEGTIGLRFPGGCTLDLLEDEFCTHFRCVDESCKKAYPQLFTTSATAAARATEAEYQYDHWQFPLPVKDVGGWEDSGVGGRIYTRLVYLETEGHHPSIRARFSVEFMEGTAQLVEVRCHLEEDDQFGHPS